MNPSNALRRALTEPTSEVLWELRGDLLESGVAPERRALIDELTAPLLDPGTSTAVKAVLAGRIFQVLLLARMNEV